MPEVVFLTAYDQFALKAFDAQALDYLVKPVSAARFATTMKRLTKQLRSGARSGEAGAIVVSTARGTLVVPLREIDWIESADNYARIWTGGKSYLLRQSLGALEERIGDRGFVRAHRQALVRIEAVQRLTTTDAGECIAVLSSGTRIPVSRRRPRVRGQRPRFPLPFWRTLRPARPREQRVPSREGLRRFSRRRFSCHSVRRAPRQRFHFFRSSPRRR